MTMRLPWSRFGGTFFQPFSKTIHRQSDDGWFLKTVEKKSRRSGTKAAAWSSNGVSDVGEGRVEVCANQLYGGDDDHRNAGGNESVLDCSRPGLVLEEIREKLIHWDKSFLLFSKRETYYRNKKISLFISLQLYGLLRQNGQNSGLGPARAPTEYGSIGCDRGVWREARFIALC